MPELVTKPVSYLEFAADSTAQHEAVVNEVRKHYLLPVDRAGFLGQTFGDRSHPSPSGRQTQLSAPPRHR